MNSRIKMMVMIGCVAVASGLSLAWFAHGQDTNIPVGFQVPMVRDLKLIGEVENLTKRVAELEAKVKILETKSGRSK